MRAVGSSSKERHGLSRPLVPMSLALGLNTFMSLSDVIPSPPLKMLFA